MVDLKGDLLLATVDTASVKLLQQIGPAFPSGQLAALVGYPFDLWVLHECQIKLDSLNLDACEGHPSLVASCPSEHTLDTRAQRRRQPPLFSSPVLEASGPVSQVGTPAATTIACSLSHPLMDFFPAMGEFRQMQRVMHLLRLCVLDVFHAHNRDSSGATARVQLEGNGLDNALRMPPILETDN